MEFAVAPGGRVSLSCGRLRRLPSRSSGPRMHSKKKTASKPSAEKPLAAAPKPVVHKATPKPPQKADAPPASTAKKPAPRKPPLKKVATPPATVKAAAQPPAKFVGVSASAGIPKKPTSRAAAAAVVAIVPPGVLPALKPAHAPKKLPAHLQVPKILLEDDTLPPEWVVRFAPPPPDPEPDPKVEAEPEPVVVAEEPTPAPTLPPHYGTRELSLIARDPFTLFAGWDFSVDEIVEAQRASARGQVLLRIFRGESEGPMVVELPVDPARRHEFIPAPISGTAYRAVLGLITLELEWRELARSRVAFVPPEIAPPVSKRARPAVPQMARVDISPALRPVPVEAMLPAWIRLAPPVERWVVSTAAPAPSAPWHPPVVTATWSPVQAGASEMLIGPGPAIPPGVGAAPKQAPTSLELGISSGAAVPVPVEAGRDFWFKVNAEVVVYGSTERDAKVTIDGRPVRLRPDGSFSFRFSLPDGSFTLPVKASAADGYSPREVVFHLEKATERRGGIGVHPQDPALRPPLADNAVSE
jgi:hypothetical protein